MSFTHLDTLSDTYKSMDSITEQLEEPKEGIDSVSLSMSERLEGLCKSLEVDLGVYDALCHNIIKDLYHAKTSILYDEYKAAVLTKQIYVSQKYERVLIDLPWYKRFFKFQKRKLKEKFEKEAKERFDKQILEAKSQIEKFDYETYSKQFNDEIHVDCEEKI